MKFIPLVSLRSLRSMRSFPFCQAVTLPAELLQCTGFLIHSIMKVALQIIALLILCHAVSSSIVVNYKVLDQVASVRLFFPLSIDLLCSPLVLKGPLISFQSFRPDLSSSSTAGSAQCRFRSYRQHIRIWIKGSYHLCWIMDHQRGEQWLLEQHKLTSAISLSLHPRLSHSRSEGNTLSDISTYTKSYELLNGLRLYWIPPQVEFLCPFPSDNLSALRRDDPNGSAWRNWWLDRSRIPQGWVGRDDWLRRGDRLGQIFW